LSPSANDATANHLQVLDHVEVELLLAFAGAPVARALRRNDVLRKYGSGQGAPNFQNSRKGSRGGGEAVATARAPRSSRAREARRQQTHSPDGARRPGVAAARGEEAGCGGGGFGSMPGAAHAASYHRHRRRHGGEVKVEARGRASVMEPPEARGGDSWGWRRRGRRRGAGKIRQR